jgi:hypothetical protein
VARLALAAAVALPALVPLALALARADGPHGHDATWCGTAITSLVIPTRTLLISDLTEGLTNLNHQAAVEVRAISAGVRLALGAALREEARGNPRAITAGGVVPLVLSRPRLRFDEVLDVPLPYALLERAAPVLAIGGCVNRLQVGMALPLALGLGLAFGWLIRGSRVSRIAGVALLVFTAIVYAPRDPGVAEWPYWPEDRAMTAIRDSEEPGGVLDVDQGFPALVRQLRHGRPQTVGFLSRRPRLCPGAAEDPPSTPPGSGAPSVTGPSLASARHAVAGGFRRPPDEPARANAPRGWASSPAEEPGRSLAFRLPWIDAPRAPLLRELAGTPEVYAEGLYGPETIPVDGTPTAGCWTTASVSLSFVTRPGILVLDLRTPGPDAVPVAVRLGSFSTVRSVRGRAQIALPVEQSSLGPRGIVTLHISAPPFVAPPDSRTLGLFLISSNASVYFSLVSAPGL